MTDFPSSLYLSSGNPASHARIFPIQPGFPAPGSMPSRPSRLEAPGSISERNRFPLPLSYPRAIDPLHISFFQITDDIFCHPFFCVLQHCISLLYNCLTIILPMLRIPDRQNSTAVLSRIFSSENSDPYTATTFSVLIVAYYSHILQFLLKYFILEFISMLLFVPCANSGIGVHLTRCVTIRNTILGKRKILFECINPK